MLMQKNWLYCTKLKLFLLAILTLCVTGNVVYATLEEDIDEIGAVVLQNIFNKHTGKTTIVLKKEDETVVSVLCEDKMVERLRFEGDKFIKEAGTSCSDLVVGTMVHLVYKKGDLKKIYVLGREKGNKI